LLRVTVGIPTFNEEENISNLLKSLVADTPKNFIISEVIISDDSSDKTLEIVDKFTRNNSLNIKVMHHPCRRGAAAAWKEIFEKSIGDVIVLCDADVIVGKNCIRELVCSIQGKIGLCASNPSPVQIEGLVGRASTFISNWLRSVRKIRLSQYTTMGRALSIRSDIAKKITIPTDIIAIDLYIQCKVLEQKIEVLYNDNAVVYFRPANSMSDFTSQVIRAINGHKQIRDYVGKFKMDLSPRDALVEIMRNIMSNPLGAISLVVCCVLVPFYKFKLQDINSAKWHTAVSTKSIDYTQFKFSSYF
jgi:glycosyltransferase involved in cell wall biosynthesis